MPSARKSQPTVTVSNPVPHPITPAPRRKRPALLALCALLLLAWLCFLAYLALSRS